MDALLLSAQRLSASSSSSPSSSSSSYSSSDDEPLSVSLAKLHSPASKPPPPTTVGSNGMTSPRPRRRPTLRRLCHRRLQDRPQR